MPSESGSHHLTKLLTLTVHRRALQIVLQEEGGWDDSLLGNIFTTDSGSTTRRYPVFTAVRNALHGDGVGALKLAIVWVARVHNKPSSLETDALFVHAQRRHPCEPRIQAPQTMKKRHDSLARPIIIPHLEQRLVRYPQSGSAKRSAPPLLVSSLLFSSLLSPAVSRFLPAPRLVQIGRAHV